MKKIMIFIMFLTMMTRLFAYEPKKECAKVKRNGDVVYYEKTELYDYYGGKPDPKARGWDGWKTSHDYVKWSIYKGYTVERLVDYEYKRLESLRDSYLHFKIKAKYPDVSNAGIALTNCFNKINGTNITPEEYASKTAIELAEYEKRTIILSVPFTTEENFWYISKTEMYCKMKAFIKEVKASK